MPAAVSDARSNYADQIAHAVNVLKRSPRLREMFGAISGGGKRPKTVNQLIEKTGFDQVATSQLAGQLYDQQLVHKTKVGKAIAYEKDRFYAANRKKILTYIANPKSFAKLPTKTSPKSATGGATLRVSVNGAKPKVTQITCDDLEQFSAASKIKSVAGQRPLPEKAFKEGVKRLLKERGSFNDWGGEPNDLYTVRVRFRGKRRAVAFAFKGPGTRGVLTPAKLGKNGDQIQRLFLGPAELYVVQYHGQVAQSVYEQMDIFATVTWFRTRRPIYYCVIDGDDSLRLQAAYPREFRTKKAK